MDIDAHNLKIVIALTVGFSLASVLGYITQRLRLSPILGYLIAGYISGPYSPGYVTDAALSEQLAEIGVVLMMFGVGMHFKWQDLISVKNIAITGAIGQTIISTCVGAYLIQFSGFPLEMGIVIGLAISVASTVVLVRVLSDNNLLETHQGHVTIGWLVVEDILTVAALILLPIYAQAVTGMDYSLMSIATAVMMIIIKFSLLILVMFTVGKKAVTYVLSLVARTRSHELLTLAVLALTFAIATGSTLIFGTSIALGAFIAGMVIGQSDVKHQASANSLPIRDAFVVLFFLSVGMIFNPAAIYEHPALFVCVLSVVLLVKPIAAFLIVVILKQPFQTALTVAFALAQIGEFSFILAEEALKLKILPDEAYDIIVACAIISIALNPLLFRCISFFTFSLNHHNPINQPLKKHLAQGYKAAIVGYGPIGKDVVEILELQGFSCLIIDRNVDTITAIHEEGRQAIFGDFTQPTIMEIAEIESIDLLVVTVPDIHDTVKIIEITKQYKPQLPIIARVTFTSEKTLLKALSVDYVCFEDEASKGFKKRVAILIQEKFNKSFKFFSRSS